jgi:hypothetical protein
VGQTGRREPEKEPSAVWRLRLCWSDRALRLRSGGEFWTIAGSSRGLAGLTGGCAQGEADESAESTVEGQSAQPGLTVGRMGDAGEMLNAQVGNIGLEHSNGPRDQQYDDTQRNGSLHHSE